MSINGILGGAGRIGLPAERPIEAPGGREATPARPQSPPVPPPAVAPPESLGMDSPTLPVEAPAGTDPELWSILTTEERAFYARSHTLGPLTYGRDESHSSRESIGRGGRLDLRV
jgi:hypothetical protein